MSNNHAIREAAEAAIGFCKTMQGEPCFCVSNERSCTLCRAEDVEKKLRAALALPNPTADELAIDIRNCAEAVRVQIPHATCESDLTLTHSCLLRTADQVAALEPPPTGDKTTPVETRQEAGGDWRFEPCCDENVIDQDGDIVTGEDGCSTFRVIAQCVSPEDAKLICDGVNGHAPQPALDIAARLEGLAEKMRVRSHEMDEKVDLNWCGPEEMLELSATVREIAGGVK